jgi:hypothetical protein
LQTADQRSGQRQHRYRTVAPRGNGRPTSAARCRAKGATCRLTVKVDSRTLALASLFAGRTAFSLSRHHA